MNTLEDEARRREFVLAHTAVGHAPLVPEVALHVAAESTKLWQVTEAWLLQHDVPPPFWAFPWAGGQALARFVLDRPELVRDQVVLDFATGSGLVGIAAMRAGARRVMAVDLDALACAAASLNADENGVALEVSCRDPVGEALDGVTVVLAGDVFYERAPATRFVRWFRALARRGVRVWVGDPERHYLPVGLVPEATYDVPTSVDLEGRESKRGTVYRVPPRGGRRPAR